MANPQKENGYTSIANEIMEALVRTRIPGEARQMLDFIIRKTYGYGKTTDMIATSQFCEATGLKKFIIHRARKRLLLANLITVSKNDNSQILSYSFQKDYEKWVQLAKKPTVSKKVLNSKQKRSQTVTIIDGHNINKQITIERPDSLKAVVDFMVDPEMGANFWDYYESNGWKVGGKTPMKNWHAAARRWIRTNAVKPKDVYGNLPNQKF